MLDRKNKRRVSMLLNAQTVYHLNKEAEREGVSIGQIVDRMVRDARLQVNGGGKLEKTKIHSR